MFTYLFNCPCCACEFDCKEGEPRTPVYSTAYQVIRCRTCSTNPCYVPQKGLMAFLDQPAFKKTDKGYDCTLPVNDPKCTKCEKEIKVAEGFRAYPALCGHYLCVGCNSSRITKGPVACKHCGISSEKQHSFPADRLLADFVQAIKDHELNERLTAQEKQIAEFKAIEAKKEEDRRLGALKKCVNCDSEQPIERLYNCHECKMVICGGCSFDSHQGHAVVKLLGIELDLLEKNNHKKYEETLGGLHGNLKYIQTTIDDAVGKVLKAGKERLTEIKACIKHEDAQKIVSKVDNAADKFEKHCEAYIPVARQLATRLTELGEDIMKDEE